jgi:hypothetical protein
VRSEREGIAGRGWGPTVRRRLRCAGSLSRTRRWHAARACIAIPIVVGHTENLLFLEVVVWVVTQLASEVSRGYIAKPMLHLLQNIPMWVRVALQPFLASDNSLFLGQRVNASEDLLRDSLLVPELEVMIEQRVNRRLLNPLPDDLLFIHGREVYGFLAQDLRKSWSCLAPGTCSWFFIVSTVRP